MADKKTSIGGQALIEGIMMRGPEKTAMAVRNAKGVIISEEWYNNTKVSKILKLPIIRGVYGMATSLILGYKCLMKSSDIAISDIMDEEENNNNDTNNNKEPDTNVAKNSEEQDKKSENKLLVTVTMIISVILAVALMVGLFLYVPSLIGKLVFGEAEGTWVSIGRSVLEGVLKIVLLIGYMFAISFMKDIRRTFMYHGAEHKTIFCYEKGLPLTVENIRMQKRFHPRCGTSFLILMLIVSIFIGFFIPTSLSPILRSLVKILLLPITIGIGYELIKIAGRHDNWFTKIISAPGVALQHLTVFEPDDSMIECAIEAMTRVIPEEDGKDNW